jgi:hypothetical protein
LRNHTPQSGIGGAGTEEALTSNSEPWEGSEPPAPLARAG